MSRTTPLNERSVPAPAEPPATRDARAFAERVLRLITDVNRELTLVEIRAALDSTVGYSTGLSPAEGDELMAALSRLERLPGLPPAVLARLRATGDLVFHHFPNPLTVCRS